MDRIADGVANCRFEIGRSMVALTGEMLANNSNEAGAQPERVGRHRPDGGVTRCRVRGWTTLQRAITR
jgi:hypothetical protein